VPNYYRKILLDFESRFQLGREKHVSPAQIAYLAQQRGYRVREPGFSASLNYSIEF
jgi:hypothetical protein